MSFDPKDPVALAQALIRCESVTPHEGGALSLLQSILEPVGFTCHRLVFEDEGTPAVDNLYARIGTRAANLCFAGHTDVVPPGELSAWQVPPFAAEIRDGIVYGRGAVDMKGAVASFVSAALRWVDARGGPDGLPGSISLLITGDEEGPAINGTVKVLDWLSTQGETLDACIVGEPSNPKALGDEIKIGRRGSLNGEVVVQGMQGHVAYPDKASNPIPKLAQLIGALSDAPLDAGTDAFQPSNLEVTIISVPNTATNVIPENARASFNIRYNDTWTRDTLKDWVNDKCKQVAGEIGAEVRLSFHGHGDAFLTKPGPLVDTMVAAVRSVTGRTPALTTGGGTSDARFVKDACPVIEFGLVNKTIHKVDEHVSVADLVALRDIYAIFLDRFFAQSV